MSWLNSITFIRISTCVAAAVLIGVGLLSEPRNYSADVDFLFGGASIMLSILSYQIVEGRRMIAQLKAAQAYLDRLTEVAKDWLKQNDIPIPDNHEHDKRLH